MNPSVTKTVQTFIATRCSFNQPILLGLSGGPDSLALYHIMLHHTQQQFAVAHIDHQWRPESKDEAVQLQKMAERDHIPFHLHRLDPDASIRNQEEYCRQERMDFFSQLCKGLGYQGVVLGHHAGDQAETVLKRVMEGSSLLKLSGMKDETEINGLILWRPLLVHTKEEILQYLEIQQLTPFEDVTNKDVRYLRARMREKILPTLSDQFGKTIEQNLIHLSGEAQEVTEFIDYQTAPWLDKVKSGPMGHYLDLSSEIPRYDAVLKQLVRKFCDKVSLTLSRSQLQATTQLLRKKIADKKIACGKKTLIIDRGILFAIRPIKFNQDSARLELGVNIYGPWKIEVTHDVKTQNPTDWKQLIELKGSVVLPQGKYMIALPQMNHEYPGQSSISKWWTKHKVPAFFREIVPVIYQDDIAVHEFLTGKSKKMIVKHPLISIKIAVEDE